MNNLLNNFTRPKIFKTILYILACIGLIILILGLLFPKDITSETSLSIKAKPNQVYNLVSNILSTDRWLSQLDQDFKADKLSYSDIKSGKGATLNFSNRGGEGYFRIDNLDSNKSIGFVLLKNGKESQHTFELLPEGEITLLKWQQKAKLSYPSNAFFPFIKYRWKNDAVRSASLIEKEVYRRLNDTLYYGYKIKQSIQNTRHFQTIRNTVTYDKFGQNYSQNIAAIYQKLALEGIATKGFPCTIIYQYDQVKGTIDMASAVEVLTPIEVKELVLESFPTHNTAFIEYFGDSAKNEPAHWALSDYAADRSLFVNFPVIEEYVTDPLKEKDATKWQTNIYYYITDKK